MATPSDKLAGSLDALHKLQEQGKIAIRSSDLSRTHRERLNKHGFLQEVMKGWYIPARPDEATAGASTAWYASYWQFCAAHLRALKGDDWCVSPEQSIALHAENWTVPKQLLVRSGKARNNVVALLHGTSLLDTRTSDLSIRNIVEKNGIRIYALPVALIMCGERIFKQNPIDMRAVLSLSGDASEVLETLLEGGHSSIAGRLAGAYRNIGLGQIADDIVNTMRSAGYDVRETDPFESESPFILSTKEQSPYVNRIRLVWQSMRDAVIEAFPKAPEQRIITDAYMKQIDNVYLTDAYHSLSIEGFQVSPALIHRVRESNWNPEFNDDDRENLNALAARGYWQAYQAVRKSLLQIIEGSNAGDVVDKDHRIWYREMFAPGVAAGIHRPADLAGYRNGPVFIRQSMHVPPGKETMYEAMLAFFELLRKEDNAAARAVLGHFAFVYIHPYMDGNGRIGRFLMNAMLVSGGYPWTVVPLERRNDYMTALEQASTNQNITPFAKFLAGLVRVGMEGEPPSEIPRHKD